MSAHDRLGRKPSSRGRDRLLYTVVLALLLFLSGSTVYMLANQSSIMRSILSKRPSAEVEIVSSDTPGLRDVLRREASGEIARLSFSSDEGGDSASTRKEDQIAGLLSNPQSSTALAPAQELTIVRDTKWYDAYLDLVRQKDWGRLDDEIVKDISGAYRGLVAWGQERYDRIRSWFRRVTPTEALLQLGQGVETVIPKEPDPENVVEVQGPVDPRTYDNSLAFADPGQLEPEPEPQQTFVPRPAALSGVSLGELIQESLEAASQQRIEDWPDPYVGLMSESRVSDLIELTQQGVLPRIGNNGQEPWRVYARAYNPLDNRPKVSIVVTNLGLSIEETSLALNLPGEVTLAFVPFANNIDIWTQKARELGHEFLLTLPMEPVDFPRSDPGPLGLLIELPDEENLRRLRQIMSLASGYVGFINFMGGRFVLDPSAVRPIITEINQRGLLYVDTQSRQVSMASAAATLLGMPNLNVDVAIDASVTPQSLDIIRRNILRIARSRGQVVVVIQPYPKLLEVLREWIVAFSREEEVTLTPLSAVAIQQGDFL